MAKAFALRFSCQHRFRVERSLPKSKTMFKGVHLDCQSPRDLMNTRRQQSRHLTTERRPTTCCMHDGRSVWHPEQITLQFHVQTIKKVAFLSGFAIILEKKGARQFLRRSPGERDSSETRCRTIPLLTLFSPLPSEPNPSLSVGISEDIGSGRQTIYHLC